MGPEAAVDLVNAVGIWEEQEPVQWSRSRQALCRVLISVLIESWLLAYWLSLHGNDCLKNGAEVAQRCLCGRVNSGANGTF